MPTEMVRVTHPDAGEAVVPRSALRQMDPRWVLVPDEPPAEPEPETGSGSEPEAPPANTTIRRRIKKEEG